MSPASNRIIVALDVPDRGAAFALIDQLSGVISTFKVGNQLFTAEGPALVRELVNAGLDVFLDLKFHDIPNTVAAAVSSASRLGVSILNVHSSGGVEMMRAAAGAVAGAGAPPRATTLAAAARLGSDREPLRGSEPLRPAVIGVTVLTSMDQRSLAEVGVRADPVSQAVLLARLARQAGLDGVVASPQEVAPIREQIGDGDFIIVTPGVRPWGTESGDQRR